MAKTTSTTPSAAALILAGGSGTRLWPRSTDECPKPFLELGGGKSLLAETFDRAADVAGPDGVFFSARVSHEELIRREFPALPAGRLVLEPERRNTAPAIALSALVVDEVRPGATLVVLPSDQGVRDPEAFGAALALAVEAARQGDVFITLGVPPTRPETGYGYLETGVDDAGSPVRRVLRFVEKPPLEMAERYFRSGNFYWNAGIFAFRIPVLLAAMEELCPEILAAARDAHAARKAGNAVGFAAAFARSPKLSIDYAVMEKARDVRTVPADCGWSDLGSWDAVHEFRTKDAAGNAAEGSATLIGSSNSLVLASERPVVLIGLDGVIVVDSPAGLLVSRKGASDDLRTFVEQEIAKGRRA